jgi:hypothetical protein
MTSKSPVHLPKPLLRVGVGLLLLLAVVLGYILVCLPLKFGCAIRQVESAKTVAEEKAAFARAARVGQIWELKRLRPSELPERARHIPGDWVLELEWLESSAWTGEPFRAYRRVLDTNNLAVLCLRKQP